MSTQRFHSVTVAALLAFLSAQAHADTYNDVPTTQPTSGLTLAAIGSQTFSFSSNPLLSVTGAKSLAGSTTSPELILKDATPTATFSTDTRLDENIFDQSSFNSTDIHSVNNLSTQNERWTLGVQQNADYDTTRTSELSSYALNDIAARHTGIAAAPRLTYTPTSIDSLSVAGSAATSYYNNAAYTDYTTYAVTPSYTHHLDPLNAATFSVEAQRYLTTSNQANRIDSVGPTVGWSTTFTPQLSGNAAVGEQASHQYASGISTGSWQWHPIFSAGLAFKTLQDDVSVTAARAQYPYGNGTEALQTNYSINENHALNPLITLNLTGSYLSADYQAFAPDSPQSLALAKIGIAYHATEHLDLTASYQYRYETLTNAAGSVQDHMMMATAIYHPQLWALFE